MLTPFFITPTQGELVGYFSDVAAAVTLPVLGYSNPSRTGGVTILPETLAQLAAAIPHFIGVKESSGDIAQTGAILRICPPDFRVFVGNDSQVLAGLSYGAAGAVGLTANVIPDLMVGIYDSFAAGDLDAARTFQQRVAIFREGRSGLGSYPGQVKAALEIMGLPVGPPRLPIRPASDVQRAGLRALLERVGVDVEHPA